MTEKTKVECETFKVDVSYDDIESQKDLYLDRMIEKALDFLHSSMVLAEESGRPIGDRCTLFLTEAECRRLLGALCALREKESKK